MHSTGPFKHANSEHTNTEKPGQEGLHNGAAKQKGDTDQGGRTVVSAFSNDQTKPKNRGDTNLPAQLHQLCCIYKVKQRLVLTAHHLTVPLLFVFEHRIFKSPD